MVRKHWIAAASCCAAVTLMVLAEGTQSAEVGGPNPKAASEISGRELFQRQWLPNDPRSHGGDGLGPVFNDTSCVACHNQGGPGGAGAASQNVDIVSVFLSPGQFQMHAPQVSAPEQFFRALMGLPAVPRPQNADKQREMLVKSLETELKAIHPGFLNAQSLVVHKYSVDDAYAPWRQRLIAANQFHQGIFMNQMATPAMSSDAFFVSPDLAVPQEAIELPATPDELIPEGGQIFTSPASPFSEFAPVESSGRRLELIMQIQNRTINSNSTFFHGRFAVSTSQRNTTSLFGAGLLDSIPDAVLIAQAEQKHEGFPEISGRVCRLKDDKLGRFGWKAQTASLEDFALTACAVELGLNVPGHQQAGLAYNADYKPPALDMTQAECDALVAFLKDLPKPVQDVPSEPKVAAYLHEGKALFNKVGCATCHAENLGEVAGLYSDLLLHDMGETLQDNGNYGVFVPDSPGGDQEPIIEQLVKASEQQPHAFAVAEDSKQKDVVLGAKRNEWRTPPLWGVRDSAPYLHDGRAQSLEEAIAVHDGEAARSSNMFFQLTPAERLKVIMFLQSLTAPPHVAAK